MQQVVYHPNCIEYYGHENINELARNRTLRYSFCVFSGISGKNILKKALMRQIKSEAIFYGSW
jgi:hypothetical protein